MHNLAKSPFGFCGSSWDWVKIDVVVQFDPRFNLYFLCLIHIIKYYHIQRRLKEK